MIFWNIPRNSILKSYNSIIVCYHICKPTEIQHYIFTTGQFRNGTTVSLLLFTVLQSLKVAACQQWDSLKVRKMTVDTVGRKRHQWYQPPPPHGKKPPTAHPLTTYTDLNLWFYHFFILHTYCKVPFVLLFKCIYANGAVWDVLVSTKTFVLHRICRRHRNRFINWADMQIRPDELQILWDKVSSTAGFWGRLSREGSCCCYHGGPSPSFRVCPAINDALWFSCSRPPILVFARLYVFM